MATKPEPLLDIKLPPIVLEHSGLVLTLSTDYAAHAFLSSPRLLVADRSIWTTSPLAVAVWQVFCVLFIYFSPGYVAL